MMSKFCPVQKIKEKLAGKTASTSHGQSRVRFKSSTARYKPAGSQKVTKVPPRADK